MARAHLPAGYDLKRFGEIDSTNAEAFRLSAKGETGPLWIWADEQLKGRGRDGRAWVSEKGNLYATLMLPVGDGENASELSFVAALTLYDVCQAFFLSSTLSLKWPNDILLGGKKVAGILLERKGDCLAIGCGLNIAHYPLDTQFQATCLTEHGGRAHVGDAFTALAAAMDNWLKRWRAEGFKIIRKTWLSRAHGLGKEITVKQPSGDISGVFETLDDEGGLMLVGQDGKKSRILAGDVFFPS
ncbi:MAG: biotin--[acetyl-CoA-carboxylase] ligase [Hyphomicrobiales bacterium]